MQKIFMNSWACTSAGGAVPLTSIELQNVLNKLSQELWRKAVQMQQVQAKGANGSKKSSKRSFELDAIYIYIYIYLSSRTPTPFNDLEQDQFAFASQIVTDRSLPKNKRAKLIEEI